MGKGPSVENPYASFGSSLKLYGIALAIIMALSFGAGVLFGSNFAAMVQSYFTLSTYDRSTFMDDFLGQLTNLYYFLFAVSIVQAAVLGYVVFELSKLSSKSENRSIRPVFQLFLIYFVLTVVTVLAVFVYSQVVVSNLRGRNIILTTSNVDDLLREASSTGFLPGLLNIAGSILLVYVINTTRKWAQGMVGASNALQKGEWGGYILVVTSITAFVGLGAFWTVIGGIMVAYGFIVGGQRIQHTMDPISRQTHSRVPLSSQS